MPEPTKTKVENITVDDMDNLLGTPGAAQVMTPGEPTKGPEAPTFFQKDKVDMKFLEPQPDPTPDPDPDPDPNPDPDPDPNPNPDPDPQPDPQPDPNEPSAFDKLAKNLENPDDPNDPTKGRPKLDKGGMAQLAKALIDDKVILPFDDGKKIEDYTMEDYKELFSLNFQEKERRAQEEVPQEFFKSLPQELQYAAKYVADGGQDMKGLFRTLAQAEESKDINIDTPEGQERATRQFLQASNFGTDEEIQNQIDSWKDLEQLETKAQQFKPKLDAMSDQLVKRQLAEQEQKRKQRELRSQQYADSVYNILEKGELNGLPLNAKVQNMLYDGLINANYQSITGSATNMFGHLIEQHQYVKPNHALIAEALWLLQDPEGYKSEIANTAKNAQVKETARQLKIEQQNKGGGGEEPQPGDTRKPGSGSTLKRPPKGFFKR